jgi:Bifunctional PLP-dependent enzyme with beta-cystathionase and maltose regulon repressor activities
MTKYNFDQVVNRKGTHALKVDVLKERFGREDLIPLWVADMDFLSPPEITEAIIERAKHGIFGYTCPCEQYYSSIINWIDKYHGWQIQKDWLCFIPGIVKGIAFVVDCFSERNDSVIIQPPVYHPFNIVPTMNHRRVIDNPLTLEAGKYKMDFDDLKKKITPECKILILCNPHNPGGRVWSKDELTNLAEICYDNNILVISDEIHSDLAYNDHKHIPFASVSEKAAQNSITFMAPSKTFNIAGIVSSFSIIPNEKIRTKFHAYLKKSELEEGHIFAYVAAYAAYQKGGEWLKQAKEYLWGNIQLIDNYLKKNIPQIKAMIPEASFLVWLDCKELGLSQKELVSLFVNDAKLALNDGAMFGEGGEGYMRMNIGSPRSVIEQALDNLNKAVNK